MPKKNKTPATEQAVLFVGLSCYRAMIQDGRACRGCAFRLFDDQCIEVVRRIPCDKDFRIDGKNIVWKEQPATLFDTAAAHE